MGDLKKKKTNKTQSSVIYVFIFTFLFSATCYTGPKREFNSLSFFVTVNKLKTIHNHRGHITANTYIILFADVNRSIYYIINGILRKSSGNSILKFCQGILICE